MYVEPKYIQVNHKNRSNICYVRKTALKKNIFLAVQLFHSRGQTIADPCMQGWAIYTGCRVH